MSWRAASGRAPGEASRGAGDRCSRELLHRYRLMVDILIKLFYLDFISRTGVMSCFQSSKDGRRPSWGAVKMELQRLCVAGVRGL